MLGVTEKIPYKGKIGSITDKKRRELLCPLLCGWGLFLSQEEYPADNQENPQRFLQGQFFSKKKQGKKEGEEGICPYDGNHP